PVERLGHFANTPKAHQRLAQFVLSAAIGHHFMEGLQARTGRQLRWQFDHEETDRHFGPWLHEEMREVTRHACDRLLAKEQKLIPIPKLRPATIPDVVRKWTATSIG